MKVICIDVSNPKHPDQLQPEHYIKESEVYTVTGEYHDDSDGHDYYYLAERAMVPTPSFRATRFIPLSDICEKELSGICVTRQMDTEKKPTTSGQRKKLQKLRGLLLKRFGAQRDREIIEEVIQEIMTNRGVSREEAERILSNPL